MDVKNRNFRDLKVDDIVNRMIGDGDKKRHFMKMKVVAVNEDTIECAHLLDNGEIARMGWQFGRDKGFEEDEEAGWGEKFGICLTYLERMD